MIRTTQLTFANVTTLNQLRDIVSSSEFWPGDARVSISTIPGDRGSSDQHRITVSYEEK